MRILAIVNVEISTVIKRVSELTGLTFLFDPEEGKGKIILLSEGLAS
jgi:type II secretory pathway component GspD/PulD (secretin)